MLSFLGHFITNLFSGIVFYCASNALALLALAILLQCVPHWELASLSHWWHIRFPVLLSAYLGYQGWSFAWAILLCSYAVSLCGRHRAAIERRVCSVAYNLPLWGALRVEQQIKSDLEYHGLFWGPGPESIMATQFPDKDEPVTLPDAKPAARRAAASGSRLPSLVERARGLAERAWAELQATQEGSKTRRLLRRAEVQELSRAVWRPYDVEREGITGGVLTGAPRPTTATTSSSAW